MLLLSLTVMFVIRTGLTSAKPRHILFIAADDLGWNDVGFHNPNMITPNIDKLAKEGMILNNSYVQPLCTPSRSAWMSGIYPYKLGLQRGVIIPATNHCVPLDLEFFPQKLQALGYSTHMIGKWHLGSCSWNCTPTYRGFDTFYGFYEGKEDYYTKVIGPGIDFHDGKKHLNITTYSTYLYANRARDIINNHDKSKPMFMYLPFQSVHVPIQVPKLYEDMYPQIKSTDRRQFCGMVTAMDEAIGNVTEALRDTGMINDTLIIFIVDNGGQPVRSAGNNYPLRGAKNTIFEGGTRAVTLVSGAGIQNSGQTYKGIIHAVDWHPTIVAAAGGSVSSNQIDGVNQWDALRTGGASNRNEFVYNLDSMQEGTSGHAAIRVGDFKLIQGYPGQYMDWYKPDELLESSNEVNVTDCVTTAPAPHKWPGEGLYNLRDDPTEHNDLSANFPDIVLQLKAKLDQYRKDYVEPQNYTLDPRGSPANFGGFWTAGWC